MASRIEQVLNEVMNMSPSEKAQIAHCLIASLDQYGEAGVEEAWIELAKQRSEEIDRGEVTPVSWDDMKGRIRRR